MNDKNEFWNFEHKGWEAVADKYENSWSSLTKKFIQPLLNSVEINPGMRLLDLACGPGYVSEAAKTFNAFPMATIYLP